LPLTRIEVQMIRRLKTVITTVTGFTLIAIGVALLVLPGPGLLVIGFGLLILSAEFVWAKRALDRMKDGTRRVRDRWRS
jgi:tellurite resistance protein TerC